ncbi:MAG TPA: cupin domain-containing protein [Geminicoccus sp.]|uniref:cupin domain-containing protein n=1 Tax=Geminicoccus sp. TaxID=2024832 RepID=UPI002C4B34CA|nr:cupin domain-containing protein [Geminicoccus sp.]HWL70980.1 cupin domain-containing protein [Geminicoccus sp.]
MGSAARPDEPATAAPLKVGPRLRGLRKARGMSLVALSRQADLSIGMLSQVERGLSNPSLASLSRIAQALGVAAVDLFDARPEPVAAETPLVQRAEKRPELLFEQFGMSKQIISPVRSHRLELILLTLEPGGRSSDGPYTHDGEEGGLVLEGALELEVAGRVHALRAGDSFQFQSSLPHCFRNTHDGVTRALWAIATAPPDLHETVQT